MKQTKVTIYVNPEAQINGLMSQIKADVVRYTMEHLFESQDGGPLLFPERTTAIVTSKGSTRADFSDINGHNRTLDILVNGVPAERVNSFVEGLEYLKLKYPIGVTTIMESYNL